ncbi:MAG: transketolase [Alphaproteobacteria bacterium]|nr:transketolase [Alphaproteobacteria bacterium]
MVIDSKNLGEMSNAVRATALRALRHAKSGHIGIALGAADIITMIYAVFLNPEYDRFVLSAGHGSALLYSVLKLAGYRVGDLDSLRRLNGLPGHPEFGIDGVAATTGPLGQGVANAVGMAIAEKHFETKGKIYCLCSDGDLMEGVANEAIGFAGRYKLNNLILLWDNNGVSIDGAAQTDVNVAMRMRAAGWDVRTANGHNFDELYDAISAPADSPIFVQCNTVLGLGIGAAGTSRAHGFDAPDAEIAALIENLDSVHGRELWGMIARSHSGGRNHKYVTAPNPLLPDVPHFISTREMSGMYLSKIIQRTQGIICGSADLGRSTNVLVDGMHDITADDFSGNYINYGVREHAMAAIMNGMAYSGLRTVGSTFLVFSDYMRGAMRISALAGLPVVYVLTHDSIAVGADGPTHQPIEQLAGLRLIPNMNVFRPCNMTEVAWAWRAALTETSRPSCIVLSRQKILRVGAPVWGYVDAGGYLIYKPKAQRIRLTIIATGAEVPLAIAVARCIGGTQVASIPSVSHFRDMDDEYKQNILRGRVIAIEAGATASWFEFADDVIGIDDFGLSGPGDMVYRECGFDVNAIVHAIRTKMKYGRF